MTLIEDEAYDEVTDELETLKRDAFFDKVIQKLRSKAGRILKSLESLGDLVTDALLLDDHPSRQSLIENCKRLCAIHQILLEFAKTQL